MKKRLKIFFYLLIIGVVSFYTYKICNIINLNLTNEEFISIIMNNPNTFNNSNKTKVIANIISSISDIDISNPITFISTSFKNIKVSDSSSNISKIISNPTIYIYNTHQQEQYDSENLKDYNIELSVLTSSYILKECLEEYSIYSIVEETNMRDLLKKRNLSYDKSYQLSRELLLNAQKKYPTLKYYIDIHRDSVSGNTSTVKIDDKSYARPMFVIGMNNKSYHKNLSLMESLNNGFDNFNINLSRGIYKRNSIYNQDINSNVILIEIGGVDNKLEEVYNTTYLFCEVLSTYLRSENE